MAALQSSLYTAALALCVFSTGILNQRRTAADRPYAFFIAYLVVESLGFAFELLVAHPASPLKALWLALLMASALLPAPLLCLAIHETVTGQRIRLRSLGTLHFIAGGLACAALLPLAATAHWGSSWDSPSASSPSWHFHYIHEGMLLCMAIFAVQGPLFLFKSRRLLLSYANAQNPKTLPQLAWIHLPLLVVGTTWGLGMLRVAQCAMHAPSEWIGLFTAIDVTVTALALYLILRREFNTEPDPEAPAAPPSSASPKSKYAKSSLDPALASRIRRKLDQAFSQDQLHRESSLNLRTLSLHLNEKAHYVSQVINQELGQSFYELLNTRRIEQAKSLLGKANKLTILEIALESGFNSKSTFNAAFRRATGQTPSQYRIRFKG